MRSSPPRPSRRRGGPAGGAAAAVARGRKAQAPSVAAAEHGPLEPRVAKRAALVEALRERAEVVEALVTSGDRRGVGGEQLAPVRAGVERCERGLEARDRPRDRFGIA